MKKKNFDGLNENPIATKWTDATNAAKIISFIRFHLIKNKNTLYLVIRRFFLLSSYKGTYSNEQSLNFVIPIMVILFLGIVYVMSQRSGMGFVSFILIGVAAITMIYWIRVLKKMTKDQKPKYTAREQETKSWVYDLIKGDEETVFVAEVPGPEDKVMVRLIDGTLYIRGSSNFSKEIPIEGSNDMKINDFKYRNGVLTLRIKKL